MYIYYDINFFSFWLCSAGISPLYGNRALAVKDSDGLPYIPGKTLKGIIRESFDNMISWKYQDEYITREKLKECSSNLFGEDLTKTGAAHFSDATLNKEERSYIIATATQRYLFSETTRLDVQKNITYSLEVVVPCTLSAFIYIPDHISTNMTKLLEHFHDSLRYIKRIGSHSKSGYGRCQIITRNTSKSNNEENTI